MTIPPVLIAFCVKRSAAEWWTGIAAPWILSLAARPP
jgi:hypothetical protein